MKDILMMTSITVIVLKILNKMKDIELRSISVILFHFKEFSLAGWWLKDEREKVITFETFHS